MHAEGDRESLARLQLDVATARLLVWVARVGRDAELTPGAHGYFCDRYRRLADCYRHRGREVRAREMERRAFDHAMQGGWDDGPPYAAAIALPRPRQWLKTNAVSHYGAGGPDEAA